VKSAYKGNAGQIRNPVIPAKAGIQGARCLQAFWIPAFAGMTMA
jgi:hypothetical protein